MKTGGSLVVHGGGNISLLARILGERLTIHSLSALSPPPSFLEEEISSCTLIPLFMPGSVHSGSVS